MNSLDVDGDGQDDFTIMMFQHFKDEIAPSSYEKAGGFKQWWFYAITKIQKRIFAPKKKEESV